MAWNKKGIAITSIIIFLLIGAGLYFGVKACSNSSKSKKTINIAGGCLDSIVAGRLYVCDLNIDGPNDDPLNISLIDSPEGMVGSPERFDNGHGVYKIRWESPVKGSYTGITVKVVNGRSEDGSNSKVYTFNLDVNEGVGSPPPPNTVSPDKVAPGTGVQSDGSYCPDSEASVPYEYMANHSIVIKWVSGAEPEFRISSSLDPNCTNAPAQFIGSSGSLKAERDSLGDNSYFFSCDGTGYWIDLIMGSDCVISVASR